METGRHNIYGASINGLTERIIGFAIEVHRGLGPGLLESAYEECLCYELQCANLNLNANYLCQFFTGRSN
jgi:GxxExxY protein